MVGKKWLTDIPSCAASPHRKKSFVFTREARSATKNSQPLRSKLKEWYHKTSDSYKTKQRDLKLVLLVRVSDKKKETYSVPAERTMSIMNSGVLI